MMMKRYLQLLLFLAITVPCLFGQGTPIRRPIIQEAIDVFSDPFSVMAAYGDVRSSAGSPMGAINWPLFRQINYGGNTHFVRSQANLDGALTTIGVSKALIIVDGDITLTHHTTIPLNVGIEFRSPAKIISGGWNFTIIGGLSADVSQYIFDGFVPGTISVYHIPVKPEWFGAARNGILDDAPEINLALSACVQEVELAVGDYAIGEPVGPLGSKGIRGHSYTFSKLTAIDGSPGWETAPTMNDNIAPGVGLATAMIFMGNTVGTWSGSFFGSYIRNLRIDVNRVVPAAHGLVGISSLGVVGEECYIEDVRVEWFKTGGIIFPPACIGNQLTCNRMWIAAAIIIGGDPATGSTPATIGFKPPNRFFTSVKEVSMVGGEFPNFVEPFNDVDALDYQIVCQGSSTWGNIHIETANKAGMYINCLNVGSQGTGVSVENIDSYYVPCIQIGSTFGGPDRTNVTIKNARYHRDGAIGDGDLRDHPVIVDISTGRASDRGRYEVGLYTRTSDTLGPSYDYDVITTEPSLDIPTYGSKFIPAKQLEVVGADAAGPYAVLDPLTNGDAVGVVPFSATALNESWFFDQLDAEFEYGIYSPAWVTGAVYYIGQRVYNGTTAYKSLTRHVSGTFATDLAAGDWEATEQPGFKAKFVWYNTADTAGDMVWGFEVRPVVNGGPITAAFSSATLTHTMSNIANDDETVTISSDFPPILPTASSPGSDNTYQFKVSRLGNDAADTSAGIANLIGVWLQYKKVAKHLDPIFKPW